MKVMKIIAPAAAALLMSSCASKPAETGAEGNVGTAQAVIDNIMTRTSVRQYTSQPVDSATIETLLRAGMAAPSAVNKQPWHLYVVTDTAKLNALSQASPNARMAAHAPLAIVVCGDTDLFLEGEAREFWVQDCSAVTENILLAAHALGLGAVWTGTYPSEERCKAVSEVLSLPSNLIPLNTIVIGYPDGEFTPKDKWKPEKVTYVK